MTSRKDFVKTAQILHDANISEDEKKMLAARFADEYEKENPRFDRQRFYDAVQTGHDKRKLKRIL